MTKNKIHKDYHGLTVQEALDDFSSLLMKHDYKTPMVAEVITGHGKIKDALVKYLGEVEPGLNITWAVPMFNSGLIIVEFLVYEAR